MKRLLLVAVFSGAALLPLAAHAQSRGMGVRGPSAPPARFNSGGFARPAPAARFSSGFAPRTVPFARPAVPQTRVVISGRRTFLPSHNRVVFRSFHRFHNRPFFASTCFNAFCDPFFGAAFGAPFYPAYAPYDYSYAPPPPQPVVINDDSNTRELSRDVERLSDEVERLRDEERSREEARTSPALQAVSPRQEEARSIILVFRDGHQLTAQNYAVAGNTLWVLNEHNARKIAIADLDVPATQQANAKNGVEFRLPGDSHVH